MSARKKKKTKKNSNKNKQTRKEPCRPKKQKVGKDKDSSKAGSTTPHAAAKKLFLGESLHPYFSKSRDLFQLVIVFFSIPDAPVFSVLHARPRCIRLRSWKLKRLSLQLRSRDDAISGPPNLQPLVFEAKYSQ